MASKRGDFDAETVLGCKFAAKNTVFDAEVKLKCQTAPKNAISDAKSPGWEERGILTSLQEPVENQKSPAFLQGFFVWCHQGLMYPCKHLYLNALPLAYIKKPRD